MKPVNILYLLVLAMQLLPANAQATDPPIPGQDLSAEDILELFGNQNSTNEEPPAGTTPDTPFTPLDDSLFDTGVTDPIPAANDKGVSAEQLRRNVESAGALRDRTPSQTNFGPGISNDPYRLRQQVQELQRYMREQKNQTDTSNFVPPPEDPRLYEIPGNSPPYSMPAEPFSQTP